MLRAAVGDTGRAYEQQLLDLSDIQAGRDIVSGAVHT